MAFVERTSFKAMPGFDEFTAKQFRSKNIEGKFDLWKEQRLTEEL
jgi:hypothetical protein